MENEDGLHHCGRPEGLQRSWSGFFQVLRVATARRDLLRLPHRLQADSPRRTRLAGRLLELADAVEQLAPETLRGLPDVRVEVAVNNPLRIGQAIPVASATALITEIGESVRRSSSLAA